MKEPKSDLLVRFLKRKGFNFYSRSLKSAIKKLESLGFQQIGEGSYKIAYWSDKYPEWVVKVHRSMKIRDCEIDNLPKKLMKYYLRPDFECGRVCIQRRVLIENGAEVKLNIIFPTINLLDYDIAGPNTGWFHGKPVFIDFLVSECEYGL